MTAVNECEMERKGRERRERRETGGQERGGEERAIASNNSKSKEYDVNVPACVHRLCIYCKKILEDMYIPVLTSRGKGI